MKALRGGSRLGQKLGVSEALPMMDDSAKVNRLAGQDFLKVKHVDAKGKIIYNNVYHKDEVKGGK